MKIHLFGDGEREFVLTDENALNGRMVLREKTEGKRSIDYGRADFVKTLLFSGPACEVVSNVLEALGASFDDSELVSVEKFVNG
jgi:hypothetical protein